jgi:hypothetical protein
LTAAHAAATSVKVAAAVNGVPAFGRRASVTSVTTPSVPSEPTNRWVRSYPATPFAVGRPVRITDPSARTTSRSRTQSPVTPYFTQHSPPAFVATLPPIVELSQEAGSGG